MRSLLLVAVLSVVAIGMNSDVCGSHADGCSIPLNLPFFYKDTFRSACDHHDICYGCVRPAAMCCLLCVSLRFATLAMITHPCMLAVYTLLYQPVQQSHDTERYTRQPTRVCLQGVLYNVSTDRQTDRQTDRE